MPLSDIEGSILPLHKVCQKIAEVILVHAVFSFEGIQDEDAFSCFSRLLDLAPNSGLGHLGLGTKALKEGRYKDAIKDLAQG